VGTTQQKDSRSVPRKTLCKESGKRVEEEGRGGSREIFTVPQTRELRKKRRKTAKKKEVTWGIWSSKNLGRKKHPPNNRLLVSLG